MNYEELLAAKSGGRLNNTQLPIGEYYRLQKDGKYRGLVDVRQDMMQSVVFSEALKRECAQNKHLAHHYQLHFTPLEEQGEISRLEVEPGVYLSLQQLLDDNPAILVQKDFIEALMNGLADITKYLHSQGIFHECYAPRNIMMRKGDNQVMLLSHGSYYNEVKDQLEFYGPDAQYVAPEVLQHGTVDGRSDVYSIGRLLETLFGRSSMPLEYKKVVKCATAEKPEDRYATVEDMVKAVHSRRQIFRSLLGLVLAVVIALFAVWLYFDMMPTSEEIEFVKPVPRQPIDDLIDDGFDPAEMGVTNGDSLSEEDQQAMREYEAKAEAIFRKNYEKEAHKILDKIYNKEFMSNSEKIFLSKSKTVIEELVERQQTLGEEAGLNPERAELIASQINERLTNEKKKALGGSNTRGIQK